MRQGSLNGAPECQLQQPLQSRQAGCAGCSEVEKKVVCKGRRGERRSHYSQDI